MPTNSEWPALHRLWPASRRCNLEGTRCEGMTRASHFLPCLPLTSQGEVTERTRPTHVSHLEEGLSFIPPGKDVKTDSLRRGMASSAIRVLCLLSFPISLPEPSHLLAGTTFQLNTLKTVLLRLCFQRHLQDKGGPQCCGISEENPAWLPGKGSIWVEHWNLAMHWWKENHRCRNAQDTKKRSSGVSETLCGWRLGKDGREAGDDSERLWMLGMEYGFPERNRWPRG